MENAYRDIEVGVAPSHKQSVSQNHSISTDVELLQCNSNVNSTPLSISLSGVILSQFGMLSKTTELCKFTLPIHTTISSLLKSFFTPNNDDLYQSKLGDNVFWSFMCAKRVIDFIGRLEVIEESEEEVIIKVTEIDDSTIITPNVFHNISDKSVLRLRIQNGIISLKPLELDQTSFTFYAKVDLEEGETMLCRTMVVLKNAYQMRYQFFSRYVRRSS